MSLGIIFGATLAIFLLVIAGMAVGVMFGRREISGSCGGLSNADNDRGQSACSLCSKPSSACQESGERSDSPSRGAQSATPGDRERVSELENCEKDCLAEGCSAEEIETCRRS